MKKLDDPEPKRLLSPAFPRNRGPIRGAVREHLQGAGSLLEVASGPGQHAFDHVDVLGSTVQPTDRDPAALESIRAWRAAKKEDRVLPPALLDVENEETWPTGPFDAVIGVNFLHMVGVSTCELFFKMCGIVLSSGGRAMVYDCFTYDGEHVSDSNRAFDARLRNIGGGVHPVEQMDAFAADHGLGERKVSWLPANNQAVSWRRT